MRRGYLDMRRLDINKVIARVSEKVGLVHASLLDSAEVTPNIHKVVVSFNSGEATRQQMTAAISNLFSNYVRPIENSFREIASNYDYTLCGFVALNSEVKEYTEEMASSGKFKTVASNCLIDESDESLWEVTSSGDNKYLVRKSQEKLGDLVSLASLKNEISKYKQTYLDQIMSSTSVNEFIAYVDENTQELRYGYVLADLEDFSDAEDSTLEVLDSESKDTVTVNPELVVESACMNGDDENNLPSTETAADYDSQSKESMKAYYSKLYAYAPEYYKELEAIINQHAPV